MPSPSPPFPIILGLANPSHIPRLNHIAQLAFSSDTHTRLKNASKPPNEAFSMTEPLQSWFQVSKSKFRVVAAVVGGEIVGWSAWAARGFEFEGHNPGEIDEERDRKIPLGEEEQEEVPGQEISDAGIGEGKEYNPPRQFPNPKISALESITNDSMQQYQAILMPTAETSCLILCAISVLPAYQGKGVGSAMVRWGTEIADEKKVFCWVHSSDTGWRIFETHGFKEVGRLAVELDEFCGGLKNEISLDGTGTWGTYIFRYMKREHT